MNLIIFVLMEIVEMSNISLINGNSLEELKNLPKESIDLLVTDPPYKLNKTTGSTTSSAKSDRWSGNIHAADKNAGIMNGVDFSAWLPLVYDVLKKDAHIYVFVNDKNLCDMQVAAEKAGFYLHNILVWKKNNCTPNRWYMKNCEFILFMRKGKSFPINNLGDSQFFDCANIAGKMKFHPTQKPVDILESFILNSTKHNDVVLDPFMGSGSTGVACVRTGRKFVGIELAENYFDTARKRIIEEQGFYSYGERKEGVE